MTWPDAGDRVVVRHRRGWNHSVYTTETVKRVTATQVVLGSGDRFDRERLVKRGDRNTVLVHPDSPEVVENQKRVRHDRAVALARNALEDADVAVRNGRYDEALVALESATLKIKEARSARG